MIRCSQFWGVHRICPGNLGVYGCYLKNFVVWLRPEQLERSPQMEDNLDVRGAPLLSRVGISGLRPQSRPTVLVFCGCLTDGHTLREVKQHIRYLPVSVGQWSWQQSWLFCQSLSPGSCQGVGQGWVHLGGSMGKMAFPVFCWLSSVSSML